MFTRVLLGLTVALVYRFGFVATHPVDSKRSSALPVSNTSVPLKHISQLQRRQDSETGLSGGPQYYGNFALGGNSVNVFVDTGSTDLAINPDRVPSNAYQTPSGSCGEKYGTSPFVTGQIAIGDYSFAGFSVEGRFCLVSLAGDGPGWMGLGFYRQQGQTVSAQTGDSPLYQFADNGLSSFAIYLSTATGGGGAFDVNGYNPAYIDDGQDFVTESVDSSRANWAFDLAGTFSVNGNSYDLGTGSGFVDSGNPTINVPSSAATSIWQATGADPSSGTFPSCNPGGDPVVFQSAAGNTFSIEAVHYVIRDPSNPGGCRSAFQPIQNSGQVQMVLGTPFMKAYYTYFDNADMLINFAPCSG